MKNIVNVKFTIKNGKIHLKYPKVSHEDYKKIASHIHQVVNPTILEKHDFNASVRIEL
jgi:hypothetical protein